MYIDINLLILSKEIKVRKRDDISQIFCIIRKTWLKLSKEEWVRQLIIKFLIDEVGFSKNLINVEKSIHVLGQMRRFDILVFDKSQNPWMLIECKAPEIRLSQKVIDQISMYNIALNAPFILVTNGVQSICAKIDLQNKNYIYLDLIPQL